MKTINSGSCKEALEVPVQQILDIRHKLYFFIRIKQNFFWKRFHQNLSFVLENLYVITVQTTKPITCMSSHVRL